MSLTGNVTADKLLRGKINGLEKIRGYSAYEIALINGFKGTEEEWLDSLNGGLVTVDKQLYRSGHAADAKVTGERFSAMDDEISVERSRINVIANLPEGSTTGDAELADIRIAHNGREYVNAGEAVRGQINELRNGYSVFTGEDFVQGYMNANGLQSASIRIRLKNAVKVKKGDVLTFTNTLRSCIWVLADNNINQPNVINNTSESDYGSANKTYEIPEDGYLMINMQNAYNWGNSTAITPADFTGEIKLYSADRITELSDRVDGFTDAIHHLDCAVDGYTSADFEQGYFSTTEGLWNSTLRIRLKKPFKVRKGDSISFEGLGSLYWSWLLFEDDSLAKGSVILDQYDLSGNNGIWTTDATHEITQDGYFYIEIANGYSYNKSTAIIPADFTGYIHHHRYDPRIEGLQEKHNTAYPVDTEKVKLFADHFIGESNFEPFLFFTDMHLGQNVDSKDFADYMDCLRRYYNITPVDNIICGGDWYDMDTTDEAVYKMGYINAQMRSITDNFHTVVGNHDTNERGDAALSNDIISNLWYRSHGKPYYSFETAKTRFFILHSGGEFVAADTSQYAWFANALMENTADNIALFFHILRGAGNGYVQDFANTITTIAKAFNDRTTITVGGTAYDFTNAKGSVRFAMAGHRHADYTGVVNDIPVVETTHMRDGGVPTFDLCFADYFNGVLNMIRIGTGENRTIEI